MVFRKERDNNTYQNAGATLHLDSTISERLHFLGALRIAMVDVHSRKLAATPQREFNTRELKAPPRVDATFDVTDTLAVCVSARLNNPTPKDANRLNQFRTIRIHIEQFKRSDKFLT